LLKFHHLFEGQELTKRIFAIITMTRLKHRRDQSRLKKHRQRYFLNEEAQECKPAIGIAKDARSQEEEIIIKMRFLLRGSTVSVRIQ
jgi:hypothetical protein